MDQSRNLVQYYIHSEIVNWIQTILEKNYADIVTVYDQLYHCDFIDVWCIQIYGDAAKVQGAFSLIENLMEIAQYKMPWLSDTTYYSRCGEKLLAIQEKLSKISETFAFETDYVSLTWFGQNDLYVMKFDASECDNSAFGTHVEQIFKSLVEKNAKPLFISNVIALHKTTEPPCPMWSNVITAFHGKILNYLSVNDVFALEIANKDHRVSSYDHTLDFDIQQHLRKRLPQLHGNECDNVDTFELKILNEPSIMCHFICKYHDRFNSVSTRGVLDKYESRLLSEMYNIQINHSSGARSQIINNNGVVQLEISVTIKNDQRTSNDTQDRTLNKSITEYNVNGEIHLTIDNTNVYSPELLHSLFKNIIAKFKNHNRYKAVLFFNEIDFNHVHIKMLASIFAIFGTVHIRKSKLDLNTLLSILEIFPPLSTAVFITCHFIPSANINISPKSTLPLKLLRIMNCDFEMATLFIILERFEQHAEIHLAECHNMSAILRVPSSIKNVSLAVVKFTKMIFKIDVLLDILERFSGCTQFNFDECFIVGTNVPFSKVLIKSFTLDFVGTRFVGNAFLILLDKCVTTTHVNLYKCFMQAPIEYGNFHIQITKVVFHSIKIELTTLLSYLQYFRRPCKVCLMNCKLISTDELIGHTILQVPAVLFVGMTFEIPTLLKILNTFSKHCEICFNNCQFYHTKSICFGDVELEPLIVKFKAVEFEVATLTQILNHFHEDSVVLLNECRISCVDRAHDTNFRQLELIQFENMYFEFNNFIRILGKFELNSTATFHNCELVHGVDQIIPVVCTQLDTATFVGMTFELSTVLQLLEKFSETSAVYFSDCKIVSINSRRVYTRNIILKIAWIEFTNIEFSTRVLLSILARFSNYSQMIVRDCRFVAESHLAAQNLTILNVMFKHVIFESQALFQIIDKFSANSKIYFMDCEFEETRNLNTTNMSLKMKFLGFHNTKFSYCLISMLQCIRSTEYMVNFFDCELNNQNLIDICTKTATGNRIVVHGTHQINETFYFELFLQYYQCKIKKIDDLRAGDELEIPVHVIPSVSDIKEDFDWENMRLICVPVNDVTIKIEILKNGELFDLFEEINGLANVSDECLVDYY